MDYPKSVPGVGLVGGKFVDENTGTGQQGSLIPSAWGTAVTDELLAVLIAAGLVPKEDALTQLRDALFRDPGEARRGMPFAASAAECEGFTNTPKFVTPFGLRAAFSGTRLTLSGASVVERMPGGLIRQMGYTNTVGAISFPAAFPNSLRGLVTGVVNTLNEDATAVIVSTSSTGFSWNARVAGAPSIGGQVGIFWCATGN